MIVGCRLQEVARIEFAFGVMSRVLLNVYFPARIARKYACRHNAQRSIPRPSAPEIHFESVKTSENPIFTERHELQHEAFPHLWEGFIHFHGRMRGANFSQKHTDFTQTIVCRPFSGMI